jgi:transposase-like protein
MSIRVGWEQMRSTWIRALARSELLVMLWMFGDRRLPVGLLFLPWVEWWLEGASLAWPWLGQQPEMRLLRWGLGWLRWVSLLLLSGEVAWRGVERLAACLWRVFAGRGGMGSWGLIVGCVVQRAVSSGACEHSQRVEREEKSLVEVSLPRVEIEKSEGEYRIRLEGEFYLNVNAEDTFWLRMVILFLRQLKGPEERQGGRATRDGRRPLVRQQYLAEEFGVPQPDISRWEKYWMDRDWAKLLSLRSCEVLTIELRNQIVDVLARFPWKGQQWVWEHLQRQGVVVSQSQVRQAAEDSGWARFKTTLRRFFVVNAESLRPRDEGVVQELLTLVQTLVDKLEVGETLTAEERLDLAHLQTLCTELGLTPPPAPPATPWGLKVKWVLFAAEAEAEHGVVRCTYCGSSEVRPKGRKPRLKRYRDENGEWQTVEVYRYRCDNPECAYGSFTHFPLGLLPYSPYRLELHLAAMQMYGWGRSSYRRVAQALGVGPGRVYQWVSTFGQELLPVAALFGVLRSSGVIGIDEKWVQVPDKARRGSGRCKEPKPRRWMYVYLAVDVYTYDLLHIAIYAHNTAHSTRSFLLALKAKGYKPKVIVTDLRQEYGLTIPQVFPNARHHECIFHALKWAHRQLKDVYGSQYAQTHPEVVELKDKIDHIFEAKTRRTAEKRYAEVMASRDLYQAQQSEVSSVFDSLERHWPTLVNSIESAIIPKTNNTVELVIRRFDQHYQNFCGFDSLASARLFLAVFEKVYRFTPFTQDAQPRIRGKCPLEIAGYDVSDLPMAQICRGWALAWPVSAQLGGVPNA